MIGMNLLLGISLLINIIFLVKILMHDMTINSLSKQVKNLQDTIAKNINIVI